MPCTCSESAASALSVALTNTSQDGDKTIWLGFVSATLKADAALSLHVHGKAAWVHPDEMEQYTFCPADASFLKQYLPQLKSE